MAHLSEEDQDDYFASLAPGCEIDLRGTELSERLFGRLLEALRDPGNEDIRFGESKFTRTHFTGGVDLQSATFEKSVIFSSAIFSADVDFRSTSFLGDANFNSAEFSAACHFDSANFDSEAHFPFAEFNGEASFVAVKFTSGAFFTSTSFASASTFTSAEFRGKAKFASAIFAGRSRFTSSNFHSDAEFTSARFRDRTMFQLTNFAGRARFDSTEFSRSTTFASSTFHEARFDSAKFASSLTMASTSFHGEARFDEATFGRDARFDAANFTAGAHFSAAKFNGATYFPSAKFHGEARFPSVTFSEKSIFTSAIFESNAHFGGVHFEDDVIFSGTSFQRTKRFGPLTCNGAVVLTGSVFLSPVTIEIDASSLVCRRTHWANTATMRLSRLTADFSDAVFESPVSVATSSRPNSASDDAASNYEDAIRTSHAAVKVFSLRGVDAAHLVLTDIDLTSCLFAGTVHLDQLRLEGECSFPEVPSGVRIVRRRIVRWTPRRTLSEEHHWRASRQANPSGWAPAPAGTETVGPAALAAVYRQLRKSLEDGKNEPDAADFYYGEMEMRRNDPRRPTAERSLLAAYWAISGYGLRGARALAWLLLSMAITLFSVMLWGLPQDELKSASKGVISGNRIEITAETPSPINPTGPLTQRLSTKRFEKSFRVVVNSTIFRSSGQSLTTAGTYIEMSSRLAEPVLLSLALLAIRSRIKR
ncbi:pentapeptide repeat-containing protein [Streptomyces sp. NBC_01443]|uniref:pentapeptide repeat-containing protein n=1 Tax=Streptomyces sp. NBC_01443 TaxID=2903868 RepID=UPI0022580B9B|nr:pentapeptide repeat-containing protein [Streptomyces sp. NBC_01443]MCX4629804.1 pentapeptide repeat-containing protein [Streptomyces sp. NBC_01443]